MSIEIEVLNGDESWPIAKPLFEAVWPADVVQKLPWGHVRWAHADLRVMIETPSDGLACHVGVYFRNITWNGRKLHIGGVGGVSTRADCRRRGYASIALNAAIQTMRDREDVQFALLFIEACIFEVPHGLPIRLHHCDLDGMVCSGASQRAERFLTA